MYTVAISSELAAMVFRVAVVGGGAAGLCAARHLAAAGKLGLPGVVSQVHFCFRKVKFAKLLSH